MIYAESKSKNTHYVSVNSLIQTKKNKGIGVFPTSALPAEEKISKENPGPMASVQKPANHSGLPDNLKLGMENLSGFSMDDVRVHYNSSKPAQLQALAYTQGTDIYVAPGQEKHLPHEAWHVAQQMQGRVQPTFQLKRLGVEVNDDPGLEREADQMGGKIGIHAHPSKEPFETGVSADDDHDSQQYTRSKQVNVGHNVLQRLIGFEFETPWLIMGPQGTMGSDDPVVESREDQKPSRWHISPDFHPEKMDREEFKPRTIVRPSSIPLFGRLLPPKVEHLPPKYGAYGHLELITKAVEETPQGCREIISIVAEMQEAVRVIGEKAEKAVPIAELALRMNRVSFGKHLQELETRYDVVVEKTCPLDQLFAAMQMSAGIKLEQISNLIRDLASRKSFYLRDRSLFGPTSKFVSSQGGAAEKEDDRFRENFALALGNANRVLSNNIILNQLAPEKKNILLGALATFSSIILLGKNNIFEHEKYLSPLLSRTDLGNYKKVIEDIYPKEYTTDSAEDFIRMVLEASASRKEEQLLKERLTIGEWLTHIFKEGKDILSWGQNAKEGHNIRDPRWNPAQVGAPEMLSRGHIFEFRALPNVPYRDWAEYARIYHCYASMINAGYGSQSIDLFTV